MTTFVNFRISRISDHYKDHDDSTSTLSVSVLKSFKIGMIKIGHLKKTVREDIRHKDKLETAPFKIINYPVKSV